MTDPLDRIADFQRRLVIPVFQEIGASPRLAAKGRQVRTVYAVRTGDDVTDDLLGRVHGARRSLVKMPRTPAAERGGEWVGPTLIVAEPPELRAPYGDPQAGIYYSSVLYRLRGDGGIFVAPFVFFWMRFDGKPHAFAHRYDDLLRSSDRAGIARADRQPRAELADVLRHARALDREALVRPVRVSYGFMRRIVAVSTVANATQAT